MQRLVERAFPPTKFLMFPCDAVRSSKAKSRGQRPYTNVRRGEQLFELEIFGVSPTSYEVMNQRARSIWKKFRRFV